MAISDEFREKLKAGKITEALTLAISEATELEITTWVPGTDGSGSGSEPQPGHRMRTKINLLEGDIDNEVGTQFIGNGPYTELRQFHLEQVREGREIIQQNLASLQKLFVVLTNVMTQIQVSRANVEGAKTKSLPSTDK